MKVSLYIFSLFRMQHIADVGIALVLLVAFSMVGAQGARELVRERISEEKRILYLAGVHPVTYWVTALIWDFFVSSFFHFVNTHSLFALLRKSMDFSTPLFPICVFILAYKGILGHYWTCRCRL